MRRRGSMGRDARQDAAVRERGSSMRSVTRRMRTAC